MPDESLQTTDKREWTNPDITLLAETNFRNQRRRFGIKTDDRRRHTYLIGKTGMGKSTVMENMIIQDIIAGRGLAVVDPHGDLAEKIIDYIPNSRVNDVIYFNPADMGYPIAFNVMETVSLEHKHLIASGLVGVFKKLWADSWGPRLEYVLRNAILALLDYPGSTMLGVMRILVDKDFRKKVVAKITDPVVRSFWVDEYSKYPQAFQAEAIAPIQNKVGQFLSSAMIRNIVGQSKSTIDIRKVMDEQKILIMNLSKGRVGEDSSALLGAMMITKIQLAAMSRIDIPEGERKDFYLYVDEFQNFATESFANILSEARKYRLDLIIGHQYIEQLDETVQAAVFGNVGTLMCFRVGAADAEALEQEFMPSFTKEDLVNLAKYEIYMKLMIDGVASNPFSATTLPPMATAETTGNREKIISVSRERYAKPQAIVEDKITRWSSSNEDEDSESSSETQVVASAESEPLESKVEAKKPTKEKYTVNCYECGEPTEINFKPDGVRPIYCPKCFKELRDRLIRNDQPQQVTVQEEPVEVVPVAPELAEPTLSLSEVMKNAPVTFDTRPSKSNSPRTITPYKPAALPSPPAEPSTQVDTPKAVPAPVPTLPPEGQVASLQDLKPGQVVRFN